MKMEHKFKFDGKIQGNVTEAFNKLTQAYEDQVLLWEQNFRWCKVFWRAE